ncbi:hypothetical protein JNW88_12780 [Micromonospora sp. ATA32]|nr:hypothetical protein [Micromonospora sp. ATA32]
MRLAAGREPEPSAAVLDAQSIKSSDGGECRGFDMGKKTGLGEGHGGAQLAGAPVTASPSNRRHRTGEELDDLRSSLEASRRRCRQLHDQVDAAATVIAALGAENTTLRRQALKTSALVVPLQYRPTARA